MSHRVFSAGLDLHPPPSCILPHLLSPPPLLFGSALFLAGTVLLPSAWRAVSLSDLFGSDSSIRSPRGHGSFFFFFFFVKVLGANCRQSSFVNDFLVKCMLSVIASRGRLEVGISYRIMRGMLLMGTSAQLFSLFPVFLCKVFSGGTGLLYESQDEVSYTAQITQHFMTDWWLEDYTN